jgi:hypothetical protein
MPEIGSGLVQGGDRVAARHFASSETGELREYELHPMARLAARAEFPQGGFIDLRLGLQKPLQIPSRRFVFHPAYSSDERISGIERRWL